MATQIQIKRTTGSSLPATLSPGELVYVEAAGADGEKLYVGAPSAANTPITVGGVYFTNMLDHTAGVVEANSAAIVDANKKVDEWNVDNISINGNAITSTDTDGPITIQPNGTGESVIYNPYVDAVTAGEATDISLEDYVQKFGGKTVVTQDGLNNVVDTLVDPPTVTIGINDAGIANVKLANDGIVIGSTDMSLGETHTDLPGLTSVVVDNVTIGLADNNTIGTASGNLTLTAAGSVETTTMFNSKSNTNFGDGLTAVTVTFENNATIDSHVIPTTDGLYDLGTNALRWRTLYVDGAAFGDVTNGVAANNAVSTTNASGLDLVVTSDSGTVEVQGILDVTNNFNVLGAAQMQTTLQVNGDFTAAANSVTVGTSNLQGATTVGSVGTPVPLTVHSTNTVISGDTYVNDVVMSGATIMTLQTDQDLTINPNGNGEVDINAHTLPFLNATYDLGSATRKWRNIYADTVSFGDIRIAQAADNVIDTATMDLILDSATGETVMSDNVTVGGTFDVSAIGAAGLATFAGNVDFQGTGSMNISSTSVTIASNVTMTGNGYVNGEWGVDDLKLDGSTLSTIGIDSQMEVTTVGNGNINIDPAGTGQTIIDALHIATGVNASPEPIANYVPGQWDAVTTVTDGLNKTYDSIANTITIGITDATLTNAKLVNDSITIGTDAVALGTTITDLNGITSLDVDTMTLDGNIISTTLTDQNLSIEPNGQGTVVVPADYTTRTGFVDDSLVTKSYVDVAIQGLDIIESARVATTSNINLASHGTIDGIILVAGDRVLVKDQTAAAENGVYVSDGTGLTRALDADTAQDLDGGTFVFVEEGTNANNGFVTTHQGEPVIDTDPITWSQFSGAGAIDAGDAMSKTGNRLDVEVDDSTIEVTADALNVKDLGILNQHIANTTIDLTAKVTNVLPSSNGGTGIATPTQYAMLVGSGADVLTELAPNTTAGYYVANTAGTGEPVWSNVIDGGSY
jgi:hypothetical protein